MARIGAASRQTPTTARTWPSVTSGKYSRRTWLVGRAGADRLAQADLVDPGGRGRAPLSAVAKSADGGATIPRADGSIGGEDPAVREADFDAQDLARPDEVAPGGPRGWPGGRGVRPVGPRSSGDRLLDTNRRTSAASAPTVEFSVEAEKSRRHEDGLGDRGQPDDDQEDPVDEDQQDRARDAMRGPEHGLAWPPPTWGDRPIDGRWRGPGQATGPKSYRAASPGGLLGGASAHHSGTGAAAPSAWITPARRARTRHSAGPAGPDTGGTPDRGTSARTARSGSRARSRSAGRDGSRHTDPVADPGGRDPRRPTSRTSRTVPRRGGEGGIRTHEVFRLNAFQERRHQPLGHLSGDKDTRPRRAAARRSGAVRDRRGASTTTVPPIRSMPAALALVDEDPDEADVEDREADTRTDEAQDRRAGRDRPAVRCRGRP